MGVAKLKAKIWVQAQIRLCDINFIPIAILRRGDPDAGAVLLKLNRHAQGCMVLSQIRTLDGDLAWMSGTGSALVPEADADAYIARQTRRDPDLWVVEIEDPDQRYQLDGAIVS